MKRELRRSGRGLETGNSRSKGLPEGYKLTEWGMIPNDWSVFSIGELFDFQSTASNSRADLGDSGQTAYVHYGDIHTRFDHYIDFSRDNVPFLSPGKSVSVTRLREGDLVVADASEDEIGVGKSVEIRNLGETEAVSGLHTFLLRSKDTRVRDGYRALLLENRTAKEQIRRLATGLKVFGISKQSIRDVRVFLPSLDEQRAIAKALSDADRLLESLEALIAKKRDIKHAAMQELLTCRIRLPGFSGKWEKKRLGDLLYYERPERYIVKSVDYSEYGDTPVLTANKAFVLGYTDEDFGICTDIPVIVFDDFTTDCKYAISPFKVKSSAIKLLRAHQNRAHLGFIFERMQLIRFPIGDHKRYYISDYQNIQLLVPNIDEQTAIAAVLSEMDAEIVMLERRRRKVRAIKQGMMEQLLTGRVRLVEAEGTMDGKHRARNPQLASSATGLASGSG